MKRLLASLIVSASLLTGCAEDATVVPTPSHEFVCEQLRSGATAPEVRDYEISQGVGKDRAELDIASAVSTTCPEFQILIDWT
jgi:hypothetical protein